MPRGISRSMTVDSQRRPARFARANVPPGASHPEFSV
jgi:hypothetical protein